MNTEVLEDRTLLSAARTVFVDVETTVDLKDNTIFEENNNSAAVNNELFVGNTNNGNARRAWWQADLYGLVPFGANVTNAEFEVILTGAPAGGPTDVPLSIHIADADWGEGTSTGGGPGGGQGSTATAGDATWNWSFADPTGSNDVPWNNLGGDFDPTPTDTTTINKTIGNSAVFDVTLDVQDWVQNPASNFGWVIIGDETTPQTARSFGSNEDPVVNDNFPSIEVTFDGKDFGDAPDSYGTLSSSNGAFHDGDFRLYLGNEIDLEPDGLPTVGATGDDVNQLADEDGISNASGALIPGQSITVDVLVSGDGTIPNSFLNAWGDWNQNGVFDPSEHLFSGTPQAVTLGVNTVTINVPAGATLGDTYIRARLSSDQLLTGPGNIPNPHGGATDGEVEDLYVTVFQDELSANPADFGDLPNTYLTLAASGGPVHPHLGPGDLRLGFLKDDEADGQPTADADGDDNNLFPDDDGVLWVTPFVAGSNASMDVWASAAGQLDAWLDLNQSNTFEHATEHVNGGTSIPLTAGVNTLTFAVPASAAVGLTGARLRFSSAGSLMPGGVAADGEVEDYIVNIMDPNDETPHDWGDAPDGIGGVPSYSTLSANNGPRHLISASVWMGDFVDTDADGQPTASADGDDMFDGDGDDEDGLVNAASDLLLEVGDSPYIEVVVNNLTAGLATLYGWIDYNGDGMFDNATERASRVVPAGTADTSVFLTFPTVPAGSATQTFARFRLSTDSAAANPFGLANDGEVEDYEVLIETPPEFDWGDAPDTYSTLDASGGPSHPVTGPSDLRLGTLKDSEPDGQPGGGATNDDFTGDPDEDGVVFITPLIGGTTVRMDVVASASGMLDAWLDLNLNGVFDHPFEHIAAGTSIGLSAGVNTVMFALPAVGTSLPIGTVMEGATYARLRFSSAGSLMPGGPANDGEVEDYFDVIIDDNGSNNRDFGDAPDTPYPTLSASSGPSHVITPTIWMGSLIDGEPDGIPNAMATGDDMTTVPDEDGLVDPIGDLSLTVGAAPMVDVEVNNITGFPATLYGWIDYNGDGTFDNATERASIAVPDGTVAGIVTLAFPVVPAGSAATTFSRFRLSTDGAAMNPTGAANDGEVEDYQTLIDPGIRPEHLVGRDPGSGNWWQARSDGSSSFTNQNWGFWSPAVTWEFVNIADVNNDGHDDIVGRDSGSGNWWVALHDGVSSYTNQNWGFWSPGVAWQFVNVADVNNDGNDDIVGWDPGSGVWWVALSDGVSSFTNQAWGFWSPAVAWQFVNIADVNNDGDDDVVGRDPGSGVWWVALSNGVSSFANQNWGFWSPAVTWLDVNIADVNGDGNDDVVGRDSGSGNWWVALSDGVSSFANQNWGFWTPAVTWTNVKIADVNGDGNDDIVGRDSGSGVWWVALSDGVSTFTNQNWGLWSVGVNWADCLVIDVDGDGNDDIVGRDPTNGNLWVARSDGISSFTNELWGNWAPILWADVDVLEDLV